MNVFQVTVTTAGCDADRAKTAAIKAMKQTDAGVWMQEQGREFFSERNSGDTAIELLKAVSKQFQQAAFVLDVNGDFAEGIQGLVIIYAGEVLLDRRSEAVAYRETYF